MNVIEYEYEKLKMFLFKESQVGTYVYKEMTSSVLASRAYLFDYMYLFFPSNYIDLFVRHRYHACKLHVYVAYV